MDYKKSYYTRNLVKFIFFLENKNKCKHSIEILIRQIHVEVLLEVKSITLNLKQKLKSPPKSTKALINR